MCLAHSDRKSAAIHQKVSIRRGKYTLPSASIFSYGMAIDGVCVIIAGKEYVEDMFLTRVSRTGRNCSAAIQLTTGN
jgi:hypothetical protein